MSLLILLSYVMLHDMYVVCLVQTIKSLVLELTVSH